MKSRDTLYRKSGCTAYRLCRYFSIVSIDTSGRRLTKSGTQFSLLMAVHDGRVFRPMADALAEHSGDDAIGRQLHQLPGKATADAVAHIEEFAGAEVVH